MKIYLILTLITSVFIISCEQNPKKLHSFKKVYTDVPKLIKINVSNHSSDEGSDYWNNYFISVIDAKSGKADKIIKMTVGDARNDKGQILQISERYLTMLTDEFTTIDLQTEKIYRAKEFEGLIEANNGFVSGKIGQVNSFSQDFISVTTKQGDSYILSLYSFKLYPGNPAKYWEIPDSLKFYHMERLNRRMASGVPQSSVYVSENDKGYAIEKDVANPGKAYIYEYDIQKFKPQSSKESDYVSVTILDTVSFSYKALTETRKQIDAKSYLSAQVSNLIGKNLYFNHLNEIGENSKKLFSCFDIAEKKLKYSIELPGFNDKRMDLYGSLIWSKDLKSFYYCKFGTTEPIYEYDALSGKLIAKYEN